ncbi:hypothetical protein [Companilactobacillus jidongensis]|uniref:hypothetical protein n=1 Tax=Companilactobacillus jidongensis TaxID=2486006 RepID=UPI000F79EE0B|nr:hypothetical protein [Companilactobacillus jidongensis]
MAKFIDVKYPDGSEKIFKSISSVENDSTYLTLDNTVNEVHVHIPTQSVAPKLYFYVINSDEINDTLIENLPNVYTTHSALIRFFDGKYNVNAKKNIKLDGKYLTYISGDNIIFVKIDKKNDHT